MKKKRLFRIRNNTQAIIAGIIVGIIAVITIVCMLSAILVNVDVPFEYVRYLWFAPAVLAGLVSGAVSGLYVKTKCFLRGGLSSLIVGILTILVLLFVNSFFIDLIIFLILPVFALCGSIGAIFTSNLK